MFLLDGWTEEMKESRKQEGTVIRGITKMARRQDITSPNSIRRSADEEISRSVNINILKDNIQKPILIRQQLNKEIFQVFLKNEE